MNTNGIGNSYAAQEAASQAAAANDKTKGAGRANRPFGQKEIGTPQLSEKAQKYYEKLKKKYANMEFILVSADMKEEAEANIGKYASNKSLIVLIDDEKIEKMAEDEAYRKKYEGILDNATDKFAQMKASLGKNADSVKAYGMKFDDHGNASFFAVIDKSLASQRERIQNRREQQAEDRKEAEKKAAKEKLQDWQGRPEDMVTVEASSWDELLQKINETVAKSRSDLVQTPSEAMVGQQFDYTI
ncbi:hypothetical protein D3Z36_13770 [Lachnospiraceae bacterium]|nr:hypothetical protein [Lachnospiraceae bacterium]